MDEQFFQDGPVLHNQYDDDWILRGHLAAQFPSDCLDQIEPDLRRFGQRVIADILDWAHDAENNPPRLVPYDPWGRRIDQIVTARGWSELDRISAEEGLVAIGYERKFGPWSRLYQFSKLYMFHASSAIYSCPLAMTDGAARVIEVLGDEELRTRTLPRLITRDPDQFWTSGQWMTERAGGSDVGRTGTVARKSGGAYRLFGNKWFTSATTSQMTMTLARIEDAAGAAVAGSRGLSLFYLETRQPDGRYNNIQVHRLKDKLGTRALPTAELTLNGSLARLVGTPGAGVRNIATLVNITRVYNAVCSVSTLRRCVALARDYARRREAFGRKLCEQPLHLATLANLQLEHAAAFQLAFRAVELLGKVECGEASESEAALLRILTPIVKLYTARQCVAVASETLEAFGGAGYVEDTGLPKLLRDAQVTSIWEGTTNILSLDVLRAMEKEQAWEPFVADVRRMLQQVDHPDLAGSRGKVQAALHAANEYLSAAFAEGGASLQAGARHFAFHLARVYAAALLLIRGQRDADSDRRSIELARRWCERPFEDLRIVDSDRRNADLALAMDLPLPVEAEMESAVAAG